jgi:membrane-associated protease RseP (regulator of RpoE activity)
MKTTDTELEQAGSDWARPGLLVAAVVLLGYRFGAAVVLIALAIVVMIFLHELGHFLTAKWAGMKVTEFFIGFGPRIWSFHKGETEYGVKAIPAGAYVKIIGMNNLDEVDPADEERTYRAKPYWRRLSVAVAGSTMHFILAFALACVVFMGFGRPDDLRHWTVQGVSEKTPAAEAGLQAGDRIITFEGHHFGDYDALAAAIGRHPGERVELVVERDGKRRTIVATLADHRPGATEPRGFLGISPKPGTTHYGVGYTVGQMGSVAKQSVVGLGHLFSPRGVRNYVDTLAGEPHTPPGLPEGADRPTSVVGIVHVGSEAAKNGIVNVFFLLFAVNMFIGIFNLLPILPFDGGHVAIATYEKIRSMISGRRYQADVGKLMPLTYAVVLVLALLFVTTIYLDIAHPVNLG